MKKLLLAAVAASVAATGFAGSANGSFAAPSAQPASAPSAYVEGALGYARTNFENYGFGTLGTAPSHGNGAFAGGLDAGYNFMPHLGVEAGFEMPFQKASVKGASAQHITTYSFYGAGRLNATVAQNFNVFALAGVGYTHVSDKTVANVEAKTSAFGFVGGFGANYMVADNITVGVKYLKFAGRTKEDSSNKKFPGPQYYLATVGYNFG